ncbi:MAG: D-alanyl-D-alanine carboxypeptidase [Daejeonella sp.]
MKVLQVLLALVLLNTLQTVEAKTIRPRKILKLIKRSEVLKRHFTGFMLYDLDKRKVIAEHLSKAYFTPASNTKLFTFYAGLELLKDSLAGLEYIERNDSLIFWGTADPTFLHPDFLQHRTLDRLKNSGKKLYWAKGRYTGDFYGTGWSYDDYNEYYQPEISELPVYGNVIRTSVKNNMLISSPAFSRDGLFKLSTDSVNQRDTYFIRRDIYSNVFYQPNLEFPATYNQEIPFKITDDVVSGLLKASLPNYQGIIHYPKPLQTKIIYSTPKDSVFRRMLLPSDNFIAEHLLLNYAAAKDLPMKTSAVIDYITTNYLSDLPDKPQWVDGSGLSRQNLFTPRDMVKLCEKIYDKVDNEELLFNLLPQGGKTGTLRNLYKSEDNVFIFAKTGTLSNNHNLTGYLITKSGKRLIFSFMNNNYVLPTNDVRKEMERILTLIHQKY